MGCIWKYQMVVQLIKDKTISFGCFWSVDDFISPVEFTYHGVILLGACPDVF
jgi:hypothetical protein